MAHFHEQVGVWLGLSTRVLVLLHRTLLLRLLHSRMVGFQEKMFPKTWAEAIKLLLASEVPDVVSLRLPFFHVGALSHVYPSGSPFLLSTEFSSESSHYQSQSKH